MHEPVTAIRFMTPSVRLRKTGAVMAPPRTRLPGRSVCSSTPRRKARRLPRVGSVTAMEIHIIHENPEWLPPFAAALEAEGVPWREWSLGEGVLDLDETPPAGVFYSRMSASSHTRGHVAAKDHTRAVLSWLEAHGRRVVNGRRVLELEMSKVDQLSALQAFGLPTPRTIAVAGLRHLREEARRLPLPFITKHNQGGKGLGVRRFDTHEAFDAYVGSDDFEMPVDHITLLQE